MSSWPSVIVDVDLKKTKKLLLSRVSKVHHVLHPWRGPTRCRHNLESRKTREGTADSYDIHPASISVFHVLGSMRRIQNKLYNMYLRNTSNYLCLSLLDTSRRTPKLSHQNYRSISIVVPNRYATG